jgi:hypothetical protein
MSASQLFAAQQFELSGAQHALPATKSILIVYIRKLLPRNSGTDGRL